MKLMALLLLAASLWGGWSWYQHAADAPPEALQQAAPGARVPVAAAGGGRSALPPELREGGGAQAAVAGSGLLQQHNRDGLAALNAGRYADAVDQFRHALEVQADNPVVLLNLARCYAQWGQAEIDAGRMQRALPLLREAAAAHADGGETASLLAYALLRTGNREQAARVLAAALEDFPQSASALRLAAEAASLNGELAQAVVLLERAVALQPQSDALEQRLDGYRQEMEMLANAERGRSTRFECVYDPTTPGLAAAVPSLMLDLEAAAAVVDRMLGLQPDDRLLVLLLDRQLYDLAAPNWSNGLYDGRIRVPIDDFESKREQLAAVFRHEYTHAALHQLGPVVPTWLHEGLAQLLEGRSVDRGRTRLQQEGARLPSATGLVGDWTRWQERAEVQGAYDYALSLTDWLLEHYGQDSFTTLIRELGQVEFDRAFEGIYGQPWAELDASHRAAFESP